MNKKENWSYITSMMRVFDSQNGILELFSEIAKKIYNNTTKFKKTEEMTGSIWVREKGGGFRMGNTGIPVADSFWYLAKLIQYCKV